MVRFITEAIGSLILVFAIGIAGDPVTAGIILTVLLYIAFSFTDAHLNPAVSMGVWTLEKESTGLLFIRFAGQFTGAGAGAWFTYWMSGFIFAPGPSSSIDVAEFIVLELLFSFLFVLLFLLMVFPPSNRKLSIFGVIIGFGYAGFLLILEPLTGFGMHPALNSALTLIDYLQNGNSFIHLPVYLFAPLVAAIGSAMLYKILISRRPEKSS